MPLNNDLVLGSLADDIDPVDTQEEINSLSLYIHDYRGLIESIDNRISKYELDFLTEELDIDDEDLWKNILQRIIKVYSLNNLKLFVSNSMFSTFGNLVKELLYDLKLRMLKDIEEKKITRTMSQIELHNYLKENKYSHLTIWALQFIDRESYMYFMDKLFAESYSQYYEV